ncbi:MAG: hypothetical protein Q9188_007298, partial [Gyalolechia gomerana]
MVDQVHSLEIESWTLYPFGLLLVAARMIVKVTFTGVIVSVNQVSHNLSNYLPAGAAEKFTPEEKKNAIFGSKFVMILEEFMLANTCPNHPPPEIPLPSSPTNSSPIQPPLTPSPHPQILSAVLNRYYNFTAGFGSLIYLNWYVGEAATSVFVANAPHLWPLLSRLFSLSAFLSARRTAGSGSTPANDHSNRFHNKVVNAQRRHHPS